MAGKRPPIAPGSQLEGSGRLEHARKPHISTQPRFSGPLLRALPTAPSTGASRSPNDVVLSPNNLQTFPIITTTEAATKDAAPGGAGDAQRGPINEGCHGARPPHPPGGFQLPLGHRGRLEALGRRGAGLSVPTGRLVGQKTAEWAKGAEGGGVACILMYVPHVHLKLLLYM